MLCVFIPVPLILWPLVGIVGSIIGGAGYGLLSPMFATVEAVGEGKSDPFFHAINVCQPRLIILSILIFSVALFKSDCFLHL